MRSSSKYRFLFAGGGTGGHLFPAVAVAEKIKEKMPQSEILFIGTKNKIEGTLVPQLGFKFKSIWIKGFTRGSIIKNILFPVKLVISTMQSFFINIGFQPAVAVGSGGYVSGPAIYGARLTGARVILLEQNSYPGVTTRLLEKHADEIHVAFEESKKYLRNKEKIFVTGNPVRGILKLSDKIEALSAFGLKPGRKTLLVLGGSLGAASINKAIAASLEYLIKENIQVIWQTGKNYYQDYIQFANDNIHVAPFLDNMNAAYSACDLLVSRAGATTLAEITVLGIPSILIPSPNVAENHQYYNAKYLADNGASILIEDKNSERELYPAVLEVINNDQKLHTFSESALRIGKPGAAGIIAERAIKIVEMI